MSNHLAMRSGNPVLQASTFNKQFTKDSSGTMTLNGTVNKTGLSLLLVFISAAYTWITPSMHSLAIPATFLGFILALVNVFKPQMGHIFVPAYAIAQGVFLGTISMIFNSVYPGIVVQAVFLTFGTLGALLLAYKSGLIRATENFKLGVFAATGGIAFLYLINFIMGFFSSGVGIISSNNTMGILFSGFVVVIAALNLVLDFDFIEEGSEKGAPKYMEWYGAFGLLVTLIWLYLEILRLLAKLNSRR
jgi:uncharacterized YccA/Bax inhibitor family protein